MSTAIRPHKDRRNALENSELKVSAYDQFTSLLVALLIVVGFFVTILVLLWLTTRVYLRPQTVPVTLEDFGEGGEDAMGVAEELEPPGVDELPDVTEPQVAETIEAITEAISTQEAALVAMDGNSNVMGKGSGLGDHRSAGPGGGGKRPERRINYITTSLEEYANQLDFFEIELGVMRAGNDRIEYASNLSKSPVTRTGPVETEKRSFFLWRGNDPLAAFDRQLLEKAGIQVAGGVVIQFWSAPSWQLILHAEKDHAEASNFQRTSVRRSEFGVKPVGGRYEIFVMHQDYRFGAG